MNGVESSSRRGALVAALVLLGCVVAYLVTGFVTLDPASRRVPVLVGAVTVVLLLVELAMRHSPRRRRGPKAAEPSRMEARPAALPVKELYVLSSLAAVVLGIYLIGFLAALPLYLYGSIALLGGQRRSTALIVAAATTTFIHLAFERLLDYRLFVGVLFA